METLVFSWAWGTWLNAGGLNLSTPLSFTSVFPPLPLISFQQAILFPTYSHLSLPISSCEGQTGFWWSEIWPFTQIHLTDELLLNRCPSCWMKAEDSNLQTSLKPDVWIWDDAEGGPRNDCVHLTHHSNVITADLQQAICWCKSIWKMWSDGCVSYSVKVFGRLSERCVSCVINAY